METYLQWVAADLQSTDLSQARLSDTELKNCDQWADDDPTVALDEIAAAFRRRGLMAGEAVLVPLHERDSPTLTGEYVSYSNDEHGPSFLYYSADNDINDYLDYGDAQRSGLVLCQSSSEG